MKRWMPLVLVCVAVSFLSPPADAKPKPRPGDSTPQRDNDRPPRDDNPRADRDGPNQRPPRHDGNQRDGGGDLPADRPGDGKSPALLPFIPDPAVLRNHDREVPVKEAAVNKMTGEIMTMFRAGEPKPRVEPGRDPALAEIAQRAKEQRQADYVSAELTRRMARGNLPTNRPPDAPDAADTTRTAAEARLDRQVTLRANERELDRSREVQATMLRELIRSDQTPNSDIAWQQRGDEILRAVNADAQARGLPTNIGGSAGIPTSTAISRARFDGVMSAYRQSLRENGGDRDAALRAAAEAMRDGNPLWQNATRTDLLNAASTVGPPTSLDTRRLDGLIDRHLAQQDIQVADEANLLSDLE